MIQKEGIIMDTKQWVKSLMNYCEQNHMSLWEFDFKSFYKSDDDNYSPIATWLRYRNNDIQYPKLNNQLNQVFGENSVFNQLPQNQQFDPDKVAFPIYHLLGWQNLPQDNVRGDSMNSFKTTFTQAILKSNNRDKIYNKIHINKNEFLDQQYAQLITDDNYSQFTVISELQSELTKFAELTHSIGNFIVLPYEFNCFRGKNQGICDYWDITLRRIKEYYDLKEQQSPNLADFITKNHLENFDTTIKTWHDFIEKYALQPFVNKNDEIVELWDGHLDSSITPKKIEEFKQFYTRTNQAIIERGKILTERLNKILK